MKKSIVLGLLLAAPLFIHAQHAGHGNMKNMNMKSDKKMAESSDIMMSMHQAMMDNSVASNIQPELAFLINMIPHHQGAIDSSELLLTVSSNAEVRAIAQNIIAAQKKEIIEYRALISTLRAEFKSVYSPNKTTRAFDAQAKKDMDKMMTAMGSYPLGGDLNRDYLGGMIIHHQGAVDASKQILTYTKDQRVRAIAQAIIAGQEKEIAQFQAILKR